MKQIPKSWKWDTLRNVSIGSGEYGANLSGVAYSNNLYRYIRITDVNDDGSLNNNDPKSLSVEEGEEYRLDRGDILFARSGATVGKTYLHKGEFPATFAGYMIRFKINSIKANANYVFAWTKSAEYCRWIISMMRAGAQPNINATEFGNLPIILPPIAEQGRIVEVLSDADAAVDKASRLLDKEKSIARLILTKLIRKENQMISIADVVDFQKGAPVSFIQDGSGNPYIGSVNFDGTFTEFSNDSNGISCVDTDVLLLWDGENAGKATTGLSGIVGSTVARLRPKEGTNNEFLCGALKVEYERIRLLREGSGIPHLPRDFLNRFKVPMMPYHRQCEISNLIVEQRNQQHKMIRRITALEKQKRSLMQKLLSGEIRVLQKGD
ncbi:MAG: restriction endonuclease subunit S [Ectothiorhodospiraceae bacterium AqS1]|nr:restriction endonuclease subunit S [Ectothiorhodospiraceae bacterium AqS1]